MSVGSPVGTIAYIIDEEALLVRVNKGWQYIAVSIADIFHTQSFNWIINGFDETSYPKASSISLIH